MIGTRLRLGAERLLVNRRLRAEACPAPPQVPKDDNNIFSLHDAAVVDGVRAVSFDLFDTLATRTQLSLDQVFAKTADLAADLVPGDRARVLRRIRGARGFTAEALKREMQARGEGDEPSLEAIFDRALAPLVVDAAARCRMARRLVDVETEVEMRNLVPNPEAEAALRAVRASGRKVIVTSDMYLPGASIARLLDALGLARFVDHLFVSADHGVTKAGGRLFGVVAAATGLSPDEILHLGDNWHSDVVMARAAGFRAVHYVNTGWQAAAQALTQRARQPMGDRLRRARLAQRYGLATDRAFDTLDAMIDGVIGPAAGLFVADTLAAAERRGASDVYFLTRDGTLFLDIAIAARQRGTAMPAPAARLHRLATSRSTGAYLRAPSAGASGLIADTTYLTEGGFSTQALFKLYGLTPQDFAACPARLRKQVRDALAAPGEGPFRALMEAPAFRRTLARHLADRRAEVAAYLDQEGLLAAHAPVLADIGYSGTWAKQLSCLFEALGRQGAALPACEFRFFASNRHFDGNLTRLHPAIDLVPGVLLDHRDGPCLSASLNFAWLEPFLVDPDLGALTGFVRREDRIEPVFADAGLTPEDLAALRARRARIVERGAAFLDDLLRHEGDLCTLRDILRASLVRLAEQPTAREVRAINAMMHQRGMATVARQPVARRLYPNRLGAKLAHLKANDYWVQGCLSLSGLGVLTPLLRLHPGVGRIQTQEAAR
ncbi:MAG: HAD family hydrolase [Rhodobacteraceae bacterium]|jgi:FMN phosphatase YigB (HAD superfamily)|nr:HAD family hydrolase [Paracoccaceae bacterium]